MGKRLQKSAKNIPETGWGETKSAKLTVELTPTGKQLFVGKAKEFAPSVAEFLERVGRGQIALSVDDSGTKQQTRSHLTAIFKTLPLLSKTELYQAWKRVNELFAQAVSHFFQADESVGHIFSNSQLWLLLEAYRLTHGLSSEQLEVELQKLNLANTAELISGTRIPETKELLKLGSIITKADGSIFDLEELIELRDGISIRSHSPTHPHKQSEATHEGLDSRAKH